jgi:hypothetical protein
MRNMQQQKRKALLLLLGTSLLLIMIIPLGIWVPRYIMFVPAVAALWPAMITSSIPRKESSIFLMKAIVIMLSIIYISPNLLNWNSGNNLLRESANYLTGKKRSEIVYFEFLEEGSLNIGYLGGRYDFTGSLYDQKLTNRLKQLHYQDYFLSYGNEFQDSKEFISYVHSLDLDYICIFDPKAPGADILLKNFPNITFIEDTYD